MALDILAIAWGVGDMGWERLTYTPRQTLKKEEKKSEKGNVFSDLLRLQCLIQ